MRKETILQTGTLERQSYFLKWVISFLLMFQKGMRITKSIITHKKNKFLQWAAATSSDRARGLISCLAEQHDHSERPQLTDLLQSSSLSTACTREMDSSIQVQLTNTVLLNFSLMPALVHTSKNRHTKYCTIVINVYINFNVNFMVMNNENISLMDKGFWTPMYKSIINICI